MKLFEVKVACISFAIGLFSLKHSLYASPDFDTAKIEQITGLKGTFDNKEGVFKVSFPRKEVKVTVDSFSMDPFMGLTLWVSFVKGSKADFMIMGDLVLFQDEVNPIMSTVLSHGFEVTALHNHFFYDEPKVYFMHISGEGTLESLAGGIRKAVDQIKMIRKTHPNPQKTGFDSLTIPNTNSITAKPLQEIFDQNGTIKDGMFKATFPRHVKMSCGCSIGNQMGVNSWAAFAGSDEKAIVDGDIAIHEDELQGTLKSFRNSGINIVAIHHHMTGEQPRMLFLHYWGKGKTRDLANAVKKVLALQHEEKI